MAALSLAESPFAMLGVSVEATRDAIEDAYEDCITVRPHSEPALLRAKQILLTPRTRLGAEVRWLLDYDPARALGLVEALPKLPERDLERMLVGLAPLARANVAADAAARLPTVQLLPQLLAASGQIATDQVLKLLVSTRQEAGFPPVSEKQLRDELSELTRDQAAAAMRGMIACGHPQTLLASLVEDRRLVSNRLLDELVVRYDEWCSPHLTNIEENLSATLLRIASDPSAPVDAVNASLKQWAELSGPMQRHAERSGLDEPRSLRVYRNVRSTCIDLANEHQRFQAAAQIVETLLTTFEGLPTAAVELEADLTLLKKLRGEQRAELVLKPLLEAIEVARNDVAGLAASLKGGGAAAARLPVVRGIGDALSTAHRDLAGTDFSEAPARVVRTLTLELNNERNDAAGALALLEAVTTVAADDGVMAALAEDVRTLRNNLGWERLNAAINKRRLGVALAAADGLLAGKLDDEDRAKILSIRKTVQGRQNQRVGGFLVWGVIGTVVVIGGITSEPSKNGTSATTSYAPASPTYGGDGTPPTNADSPVESTPASPSTPDVQPESSAPLVGAADDGREDQPPVQSGEVLTRDQIRYCVFTKARLVAAKPLITDSGTGNFNLAIKDYNSRCGTFRYVQNDLDAANTDLQSSQDKVQSAAEKLAEGWSE